MLLLLFALQAPVPLSQGEQLYSFRCKACHEPGQPGIPNKDVLKAMNPEVIIRSLERGNMKVMGSSMTAGEKRAVANFITGKTEEGVTPVRP